MRRFLSLLVFVVLTVWVSAIDYYVKQTATGSGNGTTAANAASIATSNARTASAGDRIWLLGTLTTAPVAHDSGTAGNLIWYIGDGVLTQGPTPSWSGTTILPNFDMNGKNYIAVINCEITQPTGTPSARCVNVANTTGALVEGNYIHNTYQNAVSDITTSSASTKLTIRRNWLDDIGGNGGGAPASNSAGGCFEIYGTQSLIEANIITKSMDRTRPYGVKSMIRNNYWGTTDPSLYPNAGSPAGSEHIDGVQSFDFSGQPAQSQLLYEANYDTDNGTSSDKNGHSSILQFNNGISTASKLLHRFNVTIRESGADVTLAGWDDAYMYNNTSINIGPNYTPGTEYALFFQTPACARPHLLNNTWDYSLGINASSGVIGIVSGTPTSTSYNYSHGFNQSGTQPLLPSGANNLAQTSPGFTDGTGSAPHDDYTLTSGSLLRGAGGVPTTATNSGASSTALTVGDGLWFFDGWGVAEGDWISIGGGAYVQIATVSGNSITLATPATWSSGNSVIIRGMADVGGLPYGANAPSIVSGAVTSLAGTATVTVSDTFNVRFTQMLVDGVPVATSFTPSGSTYTMTWSGDGSSSHTFTVIVYGKWATTIPSTRTNVSYSSGTSAHGLAGKATLTGKASIK